MQLRFVVFALVAVAAFAQEQTQTFTFAHTQHAARMQDVLNTVRSLAEVRIVSINAAQRTLTASTTPDRLAFVSWLFHEVDQPASRRAGIQVRDNTFADPAAPVVKIFYPANFASVQQAQEAVNAIRSIAEIQRCVLLSGPGAILVRGSAGQAALAEWIVRELDGSLAGQRPKGVRESRFEDDSPRPGDPGRTAVRIYYPATAAAPQDMVDLVNGLRSIAEVQRVVGFTASSAIVLRGSPDQAKVTDWIVNELDRPTAGGNQYEWSGSVVRTAYVPKGADVSSLVKQIRELGIQRAVAYPRQRAVVLRALPAQMAAADPLLQ